MSPDMCPDIYGNIDVSEDEVQLHNPIPDEVVKQYEELKASEQFTLNLKLKPCHCALCRHNFERIGIKKAIKFNSSKASIYKKIIKKLKDSGVSKSYLTENRSKEGDLFFAEEAYKWHMYANCGLRSIRKGSRNVHDN